MANGTGSGRWQGLWVLAALGGPLSFSCATGAMASEVGGVPVIEGDGGPTVILPDSGRGPVFIDGGGGTGSGSSCGARAHCDGICVDTTTNVNNCGTCGNVCASGTCKRGACTSPASGCVGTETMCPDGCTDTTSDPNNCGMCGNSCSGTQCLAGMCATGGGFDAGFDAGFGTDSGGLGGGSYTCTHSPCTTGAALRAGCDDALDGNVTFVCMDIPSCCTASWTSACVGDTVQNWCSDGMGGSLCTDPGC